VPRLSAHQFDPAFWVQLNRRYIRRVIDRLLPPQVQIVRLYVSCFSMMAPSGRTGTREILLLNDRPLSSTDSAIAWSYTGIVRC